MNIRPPLVILAAALGLSACGDDSSTPYLEIAGGGFVFDYRNAEAFYGFVANVKRALPEGSVVEASLDMPNGAAPYVTSEKANPGQLQYSFKTPLFLTGVEKGHEYKAVVRLIDGKTGKELGRYERSFHTDVDQASLPSKPLVVGPGYQPNPDLGPSPN